MITSSFGRCGNCFDCLSLLRLTPSFKFILCFSVVNRFAILRITRIRGELYSRKARITWKKCNWVEKRKLLLRIAKNEKPALKFLRHNSVPGIFESSSSILFTFNLCHETNSNTFYLQCLNLYARRQNELKRKIVAKHSQILFSTSLVIRQRLFIKLRFKWLQNSWALEASAFKSSLNDGKITCSWQDRLQFYSYTLAREEKNEEIRSRTADTAWAELLL